MLDIWTREGTFPAAALTRLSERVKQGESYSQGAYNVHSCLLSTCPLQFIIVALPWRVFANK